MKTDIWCITEDGSLMHYGIQGQKWGNRRFQYEDGTLTPEGKIRYGRDVERTIERTDKYFNAENQKLDKTINTNINRYNKTKKEKYAEKAVEALTKKGENILLRDARVSNILKMTPSDFKTEAKTTAKQASKNVRGRLIVAGILGGAMFGVPIATLTIAKEYNKVNATAGISSEQHLKYYEKARKAAMEEFSKRTNK